MYVRHPLLARLRLHQGFTIYFYCSICYGFAQSSLNGIQLAGFPERWVVGQSNPGAKLQMSVSPDHLFFVQIECHRVRRTKPSPSSSHVRDTFRDAGHKPSYSFPL